MTLDPYDVVRVLAAAAAGTLVGVERELHDKPAGLRTNVLICVGAALFTLLSIRVGERFGAVDPTPIAAQVVTGIGFLGAGTIIHYRGSVIGLTTAATIWAVAALGMAFGAGEYFLGGLGMFLTPAVLFGLGWVELLIDRWRKTIHIEIQLAKGVAVATDLAAGVRAAGVRAVVWNLSKTENGVVVTAALTGPQTHLARLERELIARDDVAAIAYMSS